MKFYKKNGRTIKATNEIKPAAPANVFGKGVPGKGGATTNYDAELKDLEIREVIYGRKVGTDNA